MPIGKGKLKGLTFSLLKIKNKQNIDLNKGTFVIWLLGKIFKFNEDKEGLITREER